MRGGTRGGQGIVRGRAHGGPQDSLGHRACYVVLNWAELKAFYVVIIGMVPVGHQFTSGVIRCIEVVS